MIHVDSDCGHFMSLTEPASALMTIKAPEIDGVREESKIFCPS